MHVKETGARRFIVPHLLFALIIRSNDVSRIPYVFFSLQGSGFGFLDYISVNTVESAVSPGEM